MFVEDQNIWIPLRSMWFSLEIHIDIYSNLQVLFSSIDFPFSVSLFRAFIFFLFEAYHFKLCAHLTRSNRVVFYTLRHIFGQSVSWMLFICWENFSPIETIRSCSWFVCCVFVWFRVCSFVALVKFHVSFSGFVCNQNKSRNALIYLWYVLNANGCIKELKMTEKVSHPMWS